MKFVKVMFLHMFVSHSVHGGMHGCEEGVHGREGAYVVAWGACVVVGGMHGCGGHAWLQGGYLGYDEIWSMSGQYASYWNAFLFKVTYPLYIYEPVNNKQSQHCNFYYSCINLLIRIYRLTSLIGMHCET